MDAVEDNRTTADLITELAEAVERRDAAMQSLAEARQKIAELLPQLRQRAPDLFPETMAAAPPEPAHREPRVLRPIERPKADLASQPQPPATGLWPAEIGDGEPRQPEGDPRHGPYAAPPRPGMIDAAEYAVRRGTSSSNIIAAIRSERITSPAVEPGNWIDEDAADLQLARGATESRLRMACRRALERKNIDWRPPTITTKNGRSSAIML